MIKAESLEAVHTHTHTHTNSLRNGKGITLVALVVTIVVLLILAGVSINLVLGENGLITQAQEAKRKTEELQRSEANEIENVADEIEDNLKNIVMYGDVPIPENFVYVGGTKESGIVISDNENDKEKYAKQATVGTDLIGNQFVWVPVEDYNRKAYSLNISTGENDKNTESEIIKWEENNTKVFTEKIFLDEKKSVSKYKGFYIGRYEAGDEESTKGKTLRNNNSSQTNSVTIKAKQVPYSCITKANAQKLAENFGIEQGYSSKTRLVSSYAWDSTMNFIAINDNEYVNSTGNGNYYNLEFTYDNIEEKNSTKENENGIVIPTGETQSKCNIFDMGGNVWEWTTEEVNETNAYTIRGGCYHNYTNFTAGYRYGYNGDRIGDDIGFRIALFV